MVELHSHAVPAQAGRLSPLRQALRTWATEVGVDAERVDDLVLACHEAMANVVDHAYPHGAGTFDLDATDEPGGGRATVTVTDQGRWRPPDKSALDSTRGRGLKLIVELADTVDMLPGATGTRVCMSWLLAVD